MIFDESTLINQMYYGGTELTKNSSAKFQLDCDRVEVSSDDALTKLSAIFGLLGCEEEIAKSVSNHLVDSSLSGVESHGVMRALQYVKQFQSGFMKPDATPQIVTCDNGWEAVDGGGGVGIPAMELAYERGMLQARKKGVSVVAVRNVGHTGRIGAYADVAAEKGFMTICMGGGNRKIWRQVAPYGGAKALYPTNPWAIGMPGGNDDPVVVDFATSKIAGGWLYAARLAGAQLPEGYIIDSNGNPTTDPEDYFNGGAILPAGEHKGYGLGLLAEIVADALLGEPTTEGNWLIIVLDIEAIQSRSAYSRAIADILTEVRECPPAPGFERVEIPGQLSRNHKRQCDGIVAVPEHTWQQICEIYTELSEGIDRSDDKTNEHKAP
ncbi:MAG: Ldh family oxidoreductase [Gammaproteobacteria bacterium]|nr:Ldh family oxidoreductase [Gammaproteobacteria bacterium]